ncbi:MAG: LPS export ABC transporter periplasmic protein LptC [Planctomycetota bacterium]|nr:LPS export ABC transporter periplasmic protein LptC [Planctomycetota bacterium]MDE2216117.1 LPS export ABC transporter periplasmic protein LptC [Planctomycetota bacterium]
MTKRRYLLISIPAACILFIIASLIIQSKKDIDSQKENRTSKERSSAHKQPHDRTDTITQTVQGLLMPSYDEKGKEVFIMRGENTFLLNDNIYKITAPEIEVLDSANTERGTQSVLITSDSGEMNKTSNEGYLSDNVVVRLDEETSLTTNYLKYLPERKFVDTDDFVTIDGKGIKITGQGCEIDLVNKKMWIKKDAEMEMDGIKNDLFFLSNSTPQSEQNTMEDAITEENGTKETVVEKTFIRSSGQLLFDRYREANVMTFNDHVEVEKGSSTVFSDKLTVFFDPETKRTKQAIASGNVLASQGTKIAKGNFLTWDVNTQSAILEDTIKAEFVKDDLNIDALKIIFYKDTGKIDVPSSGSLKARKIKGIKRRGRVVKTDKTDPDDTTNISVKWEGKMNFLDDKREANFEKNIEVKTEDSILRCNNLDITFNDHDYNMRSFKASEKIHIIDKKDNLYSEAVGDRVTWNAKNKVTILKGYPFALLREGNKRQILSPRVLFYEDSNTILCEGEGSLYEKGDKALPNKGTEETDIKVNWKKKMVYSNELKKASFYEEVQAVRGGQKLNGDQIDAYLGGNSKISKIIAAGNVYFFSKELNGSEGFGSLLTWDLIRNTALLTGNPKAELRKEGARTFSEHVCFDMAGKRVTWEGRPHWQLITNQKKINSE